MSGIHLHWFPSCAEPRSFIHNIQNILLIDLLCTLLATRSAKVPCSQRQRWILSNVFLFGRLCPRYLSWYKRQVTTALPSAKPCMKCILASSWFEYIISTTCNYHTINTQLLYTSPIKIWKFSKIVSDWYHYCLNVVDDGNHLRELTKFSLSFSGFRMHFRTYVDINCFYYLHMRNSFLSLCRVFFKHPV
jgi:hypothetical protein